MSLLRGILVGVWLAGAYAACSRVEVVDPSPDVPLGGGGAAGEQQGGSGSLAGESSGGEGGTGISFGGAPSFIDVALWPTYPAASGNSDAPAVLAAVTALSAGSLTLPVHERWNELSGATGTPRTVAWQRLDALTKPYRDRDGSIALCIDIVDRTKKAWPFDGVLDKEHAVPAMKRTLDELFVRYGGSLSLVCFGYEVDRYLALADETERAALLELLDAAVSYASGHSQRGKARIGVAVSLGALLGSDGAPYDEFRLGDEVVAVYDPLDGDRLKAPDTVADELASALDTIAQRDAVPRPLALFEAGYPTSSALDSSEEMQAAHVDALIGALDGARDRVDFVGLYGLYDRAGATCETEAPLFGKPAEASPEEVLEWHSKRAAARCSLGLRAENADEKKAWPKALAALSRYAP